VCRNDSNNIFSVADIRVYFCAGQDDGLALSVDTGVEDDVD
jgi:hypothetical protein